MAKRVRITRFGYIVCGSALGGLILILVLVICLVSCNAKKVQTDVDSTPVPSLDPATEAEDPGENTDNPADITAETPVPVTPVPVPEYTPVPEATPTATPTPDMSGLRTPTPEEVAEARDAKLGNSGVVMRSAPNKSGSILGTYSKNTRLKVYAESGDYYLVLLVKDNIYGYIAKKFVVFVSVTPTPTPSPSPIPVPEGAFNGTVSKTKVALRSAPDLSQDSNKFGELAQGERVFVYFTYTNKNGDPFYYIEVADPASKYYGQKAYVYKTYIKTSGSVPTATPVP